MEENRDPLEKALHDLFSHMIKNSAEPIRRATRILLLANSGGLALILNVAGQGVDLSGLSAPIILFATGIIIGGAGPVIDGITLAGLKGVQRNKELMTAALGVVAKKIRSKAGSDTSELEGIDPKEVFPADIFTTANPAKFWSLTCSAGAFLLGLLSSLLIVLA